ncbi:hypothetical protein KR067_012500 [Drosophila pandora]|nr:hypothetical protein KR067_012500 [Drosophila pandora]
MYHFVSEQMPELRLSADALVTSHVTQYLKSFQLEAIKYLYERLTKREFCILNDESGLGKQATVAALLSALAPQKKVLLVLQNDDHLLAGWRFHLDTLTDLAVYTIQDVQDTTETPHSVYLAKWSQLRSIGDLSRLKFDYIFVDNRGHSLNNSFCTSMLLKHYEGRVNMVISSVDITSDVKLLFNILRLGGRLEHQYRNFQSFNRKFHLPDPKEVFEKCVDLEEYYKQRGFLSDYIKDFRLRRFRHQFDTTLPLVTVEQYKNNLNLWLASQNSQSTLSGSSDVCSTIASVENNLHRANEDSDKLSEHSDEIVAMSPLRFESSDSEVEPIVLEPSPEAQKVLVVSSDDCEIVIPTKRSPSVTNSPRLTPRRKKRTPQKKTMQISDSSSSEDEKDESEEKVDNNPKPITPQKKVATPKKAMKLNIRLKRMEVKVTPPNTETAPPLATPKTEPSVGRVRRKRSKQGTTSPGDRPATRGMQRLTRSAESKLNSKYVKHHRLEDTKRHTPRRIKVEATQTPTTSKPKVKREDKEKPTKEPSTESAQKSEAPTTVDTPKRKRGRQRKCKEEPQPTKTPNSKPETNHVTPTPQILSGSSLSSEYLQCAQRFPDNLDMLEAPTFRVPLTPQQTPMILRLPSANLLSDSEVIDVSQGNQPAETVVISSSLDESSQNCPSESRRTKALKRKRKPELSPPTSSFSVGLPPPKRKSNKSPDIFSITSDMSQIPLAQPPPASTPFEGFKIFGSEVKQFQQQHATAGAALSKKKRERSCLDILEQMFEPRQRTQQEPSNPKVLPTLPQTQKQSNAPTITQRRQTMVEEDFFEITNNGEFGSRMRLNSSGDVSPVQTEQPSAKPTQANKITKYLIGSGITQERTQPNRSTSSASQAVRKSPKSPKQGGKMAQATKLTRWFGTVFGGSSQTSSVESVSAPSTPVAPSTSEAACRARSSRSGGPSGPTRRKRLDLFK